MTEKTTLRDDMEARLDQIEVENNFLGKFLEKNAMLAVLGFTMLFFHALICIKNDASFFTGGLFSPSNITNLIGQNGYVVILAVGMLLCILTGGNIDLSVGSIVILVGAISGILIVNAHANPFISIILCLITAALIGASQAFWIAYIKIPPFITTLAGMLIFRGLALVIMDSKNIGPYPDSYKDLFNSYIPNMFFPRDAASKTVMLSLDEQKALNAFWSLAIAIVICVVMIALQIFVRRQKQGKGYTVEKLSSMIWRLVLISAVILFAFSRLGQDKGIPVVLILLGVIVLGYTYFTQNTVPGRYLYAMGGNEKAARLSGVNTKRMMFFAYTNMGFLAGVAALVCVARYNQAGTQSGTGYELDAIGACFIGGASAYGGVGVVSGAVIGAIFMGVLNMGMSILGIDQNYQRAIKGLVLLGAVIFDVLSKRRKQAAA